MVPAGVVDQTILELIPLLNAETSSLTVETPIT